MNSNNQNRTTGNQTFSIFRSTLAQELFNHGIKPLTVTESIIYKNRTVWVYDRTPETARVIVEYYNDIGKPVPHPVQRYVDRLQATQNTAGEPNT